MPERFSSFTTQELKALQSDLGFLALTVVVDNVTPSWVYVTAAGRYVPPFTYGATFPLGAGVQVAQATWATPPGIVAPTSGVGQAQLTFTSALLPPSNGQTVLTPSQQVVMVATAPVATGGSNTITIAADSKTVSASMTSAGTTQFNVTLPPGANSMLLTGVFTYFPNSGGGSVTMSVSVTGTTTQTAYLQTVGGQPAAQPQPPLQCTVSPAADGTLTVSFTLSATDGGGVRFTAAGVQAVASFGGAAIAVEGSGAANPVAVNLTQVVGTALVNDTIVRRVPISEPGTIGGFVQGLSGASAVLNLSAPIGGRLYRFHSLTASFSAAPQAGALALIQNGASAVVWASYVPAQSQHFTFPHGGMQASGAAFATLTNGGTTTADLAVTYTSE